MRIIDLEIDGFGVWSGLRLEELSDRLTLLYGPNEAGKTTLLSFVRTILYGFSPARRQRYLPPVHGGHGGGRLHVVDADRELYVRRHWEGGEVSGVERLSITDPDGRVMAPDVLSDALGNVDEAVFNNVFAIGLREIQELGALSDTDAARWLYGLSTGLDGVSLLEVIDELHASRDRLLPPDDKPSPLVQLMTARDKLQAEVHDLRGLTGRYDGLSRERSRLDAESARLETEITALEREARVLSAANLVRAKWQERADLSAELERLADAADGPADAVERLDSLKQKTAKGARRRVEARVKWRRAVAEAREIKVRRDLLRQAPRIAALAEQETWIEARARQVEELELQVVELEDQLAAEKQRLGVLPGKVGELAGIPDRVADLLRPAAADLRRSRVRWRDATAAMQKGRAAVEALSADMDRRMGGQPEVNLSTAMERTGDAVSRLRRREQLQDRIDVLGQHEGTLAEQNRALQARQLMPAAGVVLFGALFVVGVAMLGAFLAWWIGVWGFASIHSNTAGFVGFFGLLFTVGAPIVKSNLEQATRREFEESQRRLGVVQTQLAQVREELEQLERDLPGGGGVAKLQAAEQQMASLESLVDVDARRHSAVRELEAATLESTQARDELQKAERRWQQALVAAGLPSDLSPKRVQDSRQSHAQLEEITRRLDRTRRELDDRKQEVAALERRVAQVLAEFDVAAEGTLIERLKMVRREIAAEREALAKRRIWQARAQKHRRRYASLVRHVKILRRRRQSFMMRAGVRDEGELRRRAAERARLTAIAQRRDELSRDIGAAIADRFTDDELRPHIEGSDARKVEARARELVELIQERQDRLKVLYEGRGRLNEQLAILAEDRQLPHKLFELGLVERQLADAVRRWQTLALCHRVLERMRAVYETERQPETLREASEYLSQMTGGQYRRVWTPLTENLLFVEDAAGKSLPVEVLSRGSREQLFLSLRLALCSLYARRGADLPLVLDDVLVNFDAQRTRSAAAVLRDFAATGRQVLVFTCHEHIVKQFKAFKATVRMLPDNASGHRTLIAAATPDREEETSVPIPERTEPASRPARSRPKSRPAARVEPPAPPPELPERSIEAAEAAPPNEIGPDARPYAAPRPLFDGAIWHDSDDDHQSDLVVYDRDSEDEEVSVPVIGISSEEDEAELDSDDDDAYDRARLTVADDDVEAA